MEEEEEEIEDTLAQAAGSTIPVVIPGVHGTVYEATRRAHKYTRITGYKITSRNVARDFAKHPNHQQDPNRLRRKVNLSHKSLRGCAKSLH